MWCARVIERTDAATLNRFVRETVSHEVSLLSTDDHRGYQNLHPSYRHGLVRHADGEYVCGAIHTNTIEGFWSIVKRGIRLLAIRPSARETVQTPTMHEA
jgi:hypothetical protein